MVRKLNWIFALFVLVGLFTGTVVFASTTATASKVADIPNLLYNAYVARSDQLNLTYTGKMTEITQASLNTALNTAMAKNDYIHFTMKTYGYSTSVVNGKWLITFPATYWETASEVEAVTAKAVEVFSQNVSVTMNAHQKVKALHDWLVTHFEYDTSMVEHSAYAGITGGKTVCQGYALMMFKLLTAAKIPVRIVSGKAGGQNHAWNLVQLDTKWYHLDPTWDDPVPDVSGRVVYSYYMLSDPEIKRNHTPVAGYPAATTYYDQTLISLITSDKSRASFYNSFLTTLSYQYSLPSNTVNNATELKTKITTAIRASQTSLVFRYMNKATFLNDLKTALKGTNKSASYSMSDYSKTATTNDGIVTLTLR